MRRLAIVALVACTPVAPPVQSTPPIANVAPEHVAPPPQPPLTFRITRGSIVNAVPATGSLAPTVTADVMSGAGPISAIYVEVGDPVHKGQRLEPVGTTPLVAPMD